jgi:hypothetical protein
MPILLPCSNQIAPAASLGDEVASGELGPVESSTATATVETLTSLALTSLSLSLTLSLTALALASLSLAVVTTILTIVAAIVATVVAATVTLSDSEPNAVVLCTTLSDRHDYWRVVAGGAQCASTIHSIGKTSRKICLEQAVAVTSVVDSLEEDKVLSIESFLWVIIVVHILDSDMSMANNLASIELLRGCVVGVVGIGEGSSL